ncbi:unnamed protein product [Caenorhabditis sp. 36 PRJEB53466]|nr:unnamed protein product [Caenorhabditis sp. 36 PRJEB53466]
MFFRVLLLSALCLAVIEALVTVPSDTKVSIYDFCSEKVPCAPGHLCHDGFCLMQNYGAYARGAYFRSLFYR